MARYEHLPIYRAAFDLAVHVEKLVHGFSRYQRCFVYTAASAPPPVKVHLGRRPART
jgi:hypothetical protein